MFGQTLKCTKRFSTAALAKAHAGEHTARRLFICEFPDCPRSYDLQAARDKHQQSHKERPRSASLGRFYCGFPSCADKIDSVRFSRSAGLDKHFRDEHPSIAPSQWPQYRRPTIKPRCRPTGARPRPRFLPLNLLHPSASASNSSSSSVCNTSSAASHPSSAFAGNSSSSSRYDLLYDQTPSPASAALHSAAPGASQRRASSASPANRGGSSSSHATSSLLPCLSHDAKVAEMDRAGVVPLHDASAESPCAAGSRLRVPALRESTPAVGTLAALVRQRSVSSRARTDIAGRPRSSFTAGTLGVPDEESEGVVECDSDSDDVILLPAPPSSAQPRIANISVESATIADTSPAPAIIRAGRKRRRLPSPPSAVAENGAPKRARIDRARADRAGDALMAAPVSATSAWSLPDTKERSSPLVPPAVSNSLEPRTEPIPSSRPFSTPAAARTATTTTESMPLQSLRGLVRARALPLPGPDARPVEPSDRRIIVRESLSPSPQLSPPAQRQDLSPSPSTLAASPAPPQRHPPQSTTSCPTPQLAQTPPAWHVSPPETRNGRYTDTKHTPTGPAPGCAREPAVDDAPIEDSQLQCPRSPAASPTNRGRLLLSPPVSCVDPPPPHADRSAQTRKCASAAAVERDVIDGAVGRECRSHQGVAVVVGTPSQQSSPRISTPVSPSIPPTSRPAADADLPIALAVPVDLHSSRGEDAAVIDASNAAQAGDAAMLEDTQAQEVPVFRPPPRPASSTQPRPPPPVLSGTIGVDGSARSDASSSAKEADVVRPAVSSVSAPKSGRRKRRSRVRLSTPRRRRAPLTPLSSDPPFPLAQPSHPPSPSVSLPPSQSASGSNSSSSPSASLSSVVPNTHAPPASLPFRRVVKTRGRGSTQQYLVEWEPTWEPASNFRHIFPT